MTKADLGVFTRATATVMREFVESVTGPLVLRLKAIEDREPIAGPAGKDGSNGKDVDPEVLSALRSEVANLSANLALLKAFPADIERIATALISKAVENLPKAADGKDGKDGEAAELPDFDPIVAAHVEKAIAALPVPKNGQDGQNGKDAELPAVESLVAAHVQKAVAALPAPANGIDGHSVTADDVAPLVAVEVAKAVAALPPVQNGKDGVGVADALIGKDGALVLTLSDGKMKNLGTVVGQDADPDEMRRAVSEEVAKIPRPKDGEKGADGRDGTLEQLKVVQDADDPTVVRVCFKNGDPIEGGLLRFPVHVYKGVYQEGVTYKAGEGVTWAGSMWVALEDTSAKPGLSTPESRAWRLAVKAGSPGREGKTGPPGPSVKGDKGDPGRHGY